MDILHYLQHLPTLYAWPTNPPMKAFTFSKAPIPSPLLYVLDCILWLWLPSLYMFGVLVLKKQGSSSDGQSQNKSRSALHHYP